MSNSQSFTAVFSIMAGSVLLLLGIASIGFYVYSFTSSLDKADRSVIFWYLGFAGIGFTLVGIGIYFIVIGRKARKGKESFAKYSLSGLGAILSILILSWVLNEWSADQVRSERMRQGEIRKSLEAGMHSIEQVKIDQYDQNGFSFSVGIAEGLEGNYRLNISIYDRQAVFLEDSKAIMLEKGETEITSRISFDRLFQKCFNEFKRSNIYACIENSGTKTFFTLESQLILVKDKQNDIFKTGDNIDLTSMGKTEFTIDTFTKSGEVTINSFQPLN